MFTIEYRSSGEDWIKIHHPTLKRIGKEKAKEFFEKHITRLYSAPKMLFKYSYEGKEWRLLDKFKNVICKRKIE